MTQHTDTSTDSQPPSFLAVLEENYNICKSEPDEEVMFPGMTKKEAVLETYEDLILIYKNKFASQFKPQPIPEDITIPDEVVSQWKVPERFRNAEAESAYLQARKEQWVADREVVAELIRASEETITELQAKLKTITKGFSAAQDLIIQLSEENKQLQSQVKQLEGIIEKERSGDLK